MSHSRAGIAWARAWEAAWAYNRADATATGMGRHGDPVDVQEPGQMRLEPREFVALARVAGRVADHIAGYPAIQLGHHDEWRSGERRDHGLRRQRIDAGATGSIDVDDGGYVGRKS